MERSVSYPLRWKEVSSVFNFVFMELKQEPMRVDARWEIERRIGLIERSRLSLAGAGTPLQNLREMLSQLNFKLDIPDDASLSRTLSELREEKVRVNRGTTINFDLPKEYSANGSVKPIAIDGKTYNVELKPISAYPNLNLLDQEALERYFIRLGLDSEKALLASKRIVDFRDTDAIPSVSDGEGPYPLVLGQRPVPRNGAIKSFEELGFIPGFDAAFIGFLRRNFVIFGDDSRVHLQFTDVETLMALTDLPLETVNLALDYERNKNLPDFNQTLEGMIGSDAARKWQGAVTDSVKEDDPVLLRLVAQDKLALRGVYDPKQRKMMDIFQE